MSNNKASIGVSQCLTNTLVRYDGKSEFNEALIKRLSQHFNLIPICPEVECGLSVPRPPVQLVEINNHLRVLGRDDKTIEITEQLTEYSNEKIKTLSYISGYVFKARSPSCGVETTPVYDTIGNIKDLSNGIFVTSFIKRYPDIPVIDDSLLLQADQLERFIEKVKAYSLES